LQLANLRREAPAKAAAAYAANLQTEDQTFQEARKAAEEQQRAKVLQEKDLCGVGQLRDWNECERNWELATKGLVDVKESIGATSARLVQARDAAAYLDQTGK
jgi:kinetochor protein Mis14/NSL1